MHDALCRGRINPANGRTVQASFLAGGRIGVVAQEGADRTPDLEDLKTAFWRHWVFAPDAAHSAWPEGLNPARLRVGEGCESVTMTMSDMEASLLASGISQIVMKSLGTLEPPEGRLSFGVISEELCSVQWQHHNIAASIGVPTEGNWEVRVLADLANEIEAQAVAAGRDETGGFLMGRVNWAVRRITLAAQVVAPPDSVQDGTRFVLGIEGAREALLRIHEKSRQAFLAIGTWHSHPYGGRESNIDLNTLADIAVTFYGEPAVSLIWSPDGFRALIKQDWPGERA